MRNALLGPDEVADYLGVPVATLYAWRHRGCGPLSIKVGRHLRWRPEDVEEWLDEQADSVSRGAA